MTTSNSYSSISQVFSNCLSNPGEVMCKLYRSDGITQNSIIEQLYANYYKMEPYTYLTNTSYKSDLQVIENYFFDHLTEFQDHIEANNELSSHLNCEENCIWKVLETINECIKNYATNIRMNLMESEEELSEEIMEIYNKYESFLVIMEYKLPSLSTIINKIPIEEYPKSLWKYLHGKFLEYILVPLRDKIIPNLVKGIEKERRNSIANAFNKNQSPMLDFEEFNDIFMFRGIADILSTELLNEKSVHFLKSSAYFDHEKFTLFENMLKVQTMEIYQELFNTLDKNSIQEIINNDLETLERILPSGQIKTIAHHCVDTANEIWGLEQSHLSNKFDEYELRDAEVALYIKRLGISA